MTQVATFAQRTLDVNSTCVVTSLRTPGGTGRVRWHRPFFRFAYYRFGKTGPTQPDSPKASTTPGPGPGPPRVERLYVSTRAYWTRGDPANVARLPLNALFIPSHKTLANPESSTPETDAGPGMCRHATTPGLTGETWTRGVRDAPRPPTDPESEDEEGGSRVEGARDRNRWRAGEWNKDRLP